GPLQIHATQTLDHTQNADDVSKWAHVPKDARCGRDGKKLTRRLLPALYLVPFLRQPSGLLVSRLLAAIDTVRLYPINGLVHVSLVLLRRDTLLAKIWYPKALAPYL